MTSIRGHTQCPGTPGGPDLRVRASPPKRNSALSRGSFKNVGEMVPLGHSQTLIGGDRWLCPPLWTQRVEFPCRGSDTHRNVTRPNCSCTQLRPKFPPPLTILHSTVGFITPHSVSHQHFERSSPTPSRPDSHPAMPLATGMVRLGGRSWRSMDSMGCLERKTTGPRLGCLLGRYLRNGHGSEAPPPPRGGALGGRWVPETQTYRGVRG